MVRRAGVSPHDDPCRRLLLSPVRLPRDAASRGPTGPGGYTPRPPVPLLAVALLATCPILVPRSLHASHPESLSHTAIRITGARVEVEIRFQALSLIEVQPELDPSRDALLDPAEVAAARDRIEAYFRESLHLAGLEAEREEPLQGTLLAIEPQDPAQLGALDLQSVTIRFAFEAPRPLESLVVDSRLFHETNPWHKDLCTLAWNSDAPVGHTFVAEETRWVFEPAHVRRPRVFARFTGLGITHVLGSLEHPLAGADHLAFLLALLVASRRLRAFAGVVTAFTAAHAITLAASASGWLHVPPRFVDLAVALSIAYVACDNLLRKEVRDPWLEASAFGLLHGLGFAGFLGDALEGEPLVPTAVTGFHLGLEIGQLVFVLVCAVPVALLFRGRQGEGGIVPARLRSAVSIAVALCGFYWFVQRAGWLPGK